MKMLIVDDTDLIRQLIKNILARLPFAVTIEEAADVGQAVSVLSRWQPDVVTLDLQLPDGSGLNVLRAIKQAGLRSSVIVLSSLADDPYIRRACLDAGADVFLEKSSEMDKLPAVLTDLAGRSQHP